MMGLWESKKNDTFQGEKMDEFKLIKKESNVVTT